MKAAQDSDKREVKVNGHKLMAKAGETVVDRSCGNLYDIVGDTEGGLRAVWRKAYKHGKDDAPDHFVGGKQH